MIEKKIMIAGSCYILKFDEFDEDVDIDALLEEAMDLLDY